MKTIKAKSFNEGMGVIIDKISESVQGFQPSFKKLGVLVDRQTMLTFNLSGARDGNPKWKRLSQSTVEYAPGKPRIRYGTDGTPKPRYRIINGKVTNPKLLFKKRQEVRRYPSATYGLLQASGWFKNSFRLFNATNKSMKYGTNYQLAEKIMSKKNRQVLFITNNDIMIYRDIFMKQIDSKL